MKSLLLVVGLFAAVSCLGQVKPTLVLPTGHSDWIKSVQFSPDEKFVVTASGDHTAKVWEIATGRIIHVLEDHDKGVSFAKYSADGRYIVTESEAVKVWDARTGTILHKQKKGSYGDLSSDGKYMAMVSNDTVHVVDITSGKKIRSLIGEERMVKITREYFGDYHPDYSARFSSDGKYIMRFSDMDSWFGCGIWRPESQRM